MKMASKRRLRLVRLDIEVLTISPSSTVEKAALDGLGRALSESNVNVTAATERLNGRRVSATRRVYVFTSKYRDEDVEILGVFSTRGKLVKEARKAMAASAPDPDRAMEEFNKGGVELGWVTFGWNVVELDRPVYDGVDFGGRNV